MDELNRQIMKNKKLYKMFDSYERRQKWILKEMIKSFRGNVFSISGSKVLNGVAETNEV